MQIVATKVHEPTGSSSGFTVEFEGDGGERVSVVMAQSQSGGVTRENALEKAQVILLQAGSFGAANDDTAANGNYPVDGEPSDAVESLMQEREEAGKPGSNLQEGLEDTFPASDPVSSTYTSTAARDQKN
ncbi:MULTISPECIES: hypothetical protein [Rhizobium]|uniref:Uncharacterized protein n=1 Tax=Rhizobium wuzhouense TaxID=1986026 RepID=A0ABX5NQJ1_9HYPH|nr:MULTISPECIES: hypothetical protein [Rhizobium]PYB70457.1 hypothetical protein DMY87_21410 [Rhizobium wuzhouense]RKE77593.1 hypothetical protein DFO46_4561 [Rhizobium sp. AG855]